MLQKILDKKHISQKQLAKEIRLTQQAVNCWCLQKSTPTLANMQKLAGALEVDLQTIIECFVQDEKKSKKG